jgi:hypothetical protein
MMGRRALVVTGLAVVLAVPGGAALAQAAAPPSPTPAPTAATSPPGGYGPGAGPGWMTGGSGDPAACPFHESAEAQQWRAQRSQRQQLTPQERQKLIEQHRAQMHRWMTPPAGS